MTTEVEYAWAAGFIDGEGCFSHQCQRNKYHYVILQIPQKDREVLDKLQGILGGSISGPYTYQDRMSLFFRYTLSDSKVAFHIDGLWPHLGTMKKKQYQQAITKGGEYG